MTTYTCSYRCDGRQHVVHVDAANEAEASRKLRAIGMTAQIDGELVAEVHVHGWFGRLTHWIGGAR